MAESYLSSHKSSPVTSISSQSLWTETKYELNQSHTATKTEISTGKQDMALKNTLIWRTFTSCDNPMCKKQKYINMLENFYTNIVEALKRAATEVLTKVQNKSIMFRDGTRMWEKSTRLPDKHTYTGLTIINPKVDRYLSSWKKVKKSSNMH